MKLEVAVVSILALFLHVVAANGQDFQSSSQPGEILLIDPIYHTYAEVVDELNSVANAYPDITRLDSIGISTTDSAIIWALKISDNPMLEEDEPAVLYNGIHHANELMGAEICMYMIDSLVTAYGIEPQITSWINSTEIWVVPILNPDGHYIVYPTQQDTGWRKNTRDNDNNGVFNPYYDGVDLNRNYDFNWDMAMGRDPWDRYYRGLVPFSELETQAMRDFANEQNFVFTINYHGPDTLEGEVIFYPWKWSGQMAPDSFAIKQVADSMASLIVNDAGGTYAASIGRANRPYARNWQYGVKGTFAYAIEVSNTFVPAGSLVTDICRRNVVGAFYLLDRVWDASITGFITDSITRSPLQAEVRILEAYDSTLTPRKSDPVYGRYRRILDAYSTPTITMVVYKEGYRPDTIANIAIDPNQPTICNVQLSQSPWIVYYGHSINDSMGGNGDGYINPGESIQMPVTLENTGYLTTHGVTAILRSSDSNYVTITDSVQTYGDIAPGSTAVSLGSYTYTIDSTCPSGTYMGFSLFIQDTVNNSWTWNAPRDSVVTADIVYESHIVDDPVSGSNNNGELNPGETAYMTVSLHNNGPSGLSGVQAVLQTLDPWVSITDNVGNFGDIPADSSSTNHIDRFAISAYLGAPVGHQVVFSLSVTGDGGTYAYEELVWFYLIIDDMTISAPTGPDEYGYWAYDDTDSLYGYSPLYSWFEINPNHGGPGDIISEITNTDGGMVILDLPFTFKYYGTDYTTISVCANGFLKLGSTSNTTGTGYNSSIPNDSGPNRMVAPFWDDLKADQYGDICVYSDSDSTVWIVEFDNVNHHGHYPPLGKYETFQVVLYNPDSYPTTPTGDGEIVFRYRIVEDATSNTVGVENQDETIGIQWLCNNIYDPAAAPLAADRAIKFTTYVPITDSNPWVYVQNYMINDSMGGNNDSIPDPGETVDLIVSLANGGEDSANSVSTILRTTDPDIFILDSLASFGDMPPGWQANNASDPYRFSVNSAINDTLADFSLEINANQGNYHTIAYFTIGLGSPTGIADTNLILPITYALAQNFPNPMRNNTTIKYQLPRREKVCLKIYDVVGRLVKILVDELKDPGYYTVHWHGNDDIGRKASSGVYFYRMQTDNYTKTRKIVLLR